MHPNHRRMASLWAGLLALVVLTVPALSQPVINSMTVLKNWPIIRVKLTAMCASQPLVTATPSNFEVYENGVAIPGISCIPPQSGATCPMSVSMVFDCSGSMGGDGITNSILAGKSFVNKMDGIEDEAAVISFNTVVTKVQGMTKSKGALTTAINGLVASGATAVWDATYEGVAEVVGNGMNSTRAVLLLSDGMDNSSTRSPSEVISLANRNRIRLYCIGLGNGVDSTTLQAMAHLTGGECFFVSLSSQLESVFSTIYQLLRPCSQSYDLSYSGQCMDGTVRTVTVIMKDICGGRDTATAVYSAPKDTTTYSPVRICADTVRGDPNSLVTIAISMRDLPPGPLQPGGFRFVLPGQVAAYTGIQTAGTILEGIPTSILQKQDTLIVSFLQAKTVNIPGVLFTLTYRLSASSTNVQAPFLITQCNFSGGCIKPVLEHGLVSITAQPAPVVQASGSTRFCQGGNVTLTAPSGFTTYTWSNGATTASIIVTQSGTYTVTVRDGGGRTGTSAPVVVTVLPRPQPIITPSGSIISCPGKPVTLDAGAGYAAYLWSSGSTARSIQAAQSGTYSVTVTDANECTGVSPSVQVDMRPLTVTVLAFGPTTFCEGDSVLLDAGGGFAWYRWSTGATTRMITVRQGGSFTCHVADASGCEGESVPTTVTVNPTPVPLIRVLGSSRICAGDSVRLETTLPFAQYRWSTGASTPGIWVRQAGTYRVLVTSSEGCVGTSSDQVIELAPSPQKPTVTRSGNTLLVQERADQYQWYRLGVPIPGAVNQFLLLTQPGYYSVRVSNAEGCSALSDGISVDELVSVAALPPEDFEILLSPVPARDQLTLSIRLTHATSLRWEIRDLLGRLIHKDESVFPAGRGSTSLSLRDMGPGLYIMIVSGASRHRILRFLVE